MRALLRRDASRAYWDKNVDALFRENWMFSGTSGLMAYLLMLVARPLGLSGSLQRNLGKDEATKAGKILDLGIWALSSPIVWTWGAPLGGIPQGSKRVRNSQLSRLISQPVSTRFSSFLDE